MAIENLTFARLHNKSRARLPLLVNSIGEPIFRKPAGADWSISDFAAAMGGLSGKIGVIGTMIKAGELDESSQDAKDQIMQQAAHLVIASTILANRLGMSLENAVKEHFNSDSDAIGSDILL